MAYQSTPGTEDDETELIAFDQRRNRIRQQSAEYYARHYPNYKPRKKKSSNSASITPYIIGDLLYSPPKSNRK